jgi:serine/threonine-protein kinase HipA
MKGVLDVYLGRRLAGRLTQDEHGLTTFGYDAGWLAAPDAVPLSHSMLLRSGVFGRNECGAFFAGVLPESGKRSLVARNLGVSANNDYALLERIGGDCAGAVTFIESGRSLPPEKGDYSLVDEGELEQLLFGLPGRPLMAGEAGVRLSLAGVQDKLAVRIMDGKVYLPLDGSPSSHILKPAIKEYPDVVQNEAFCMRLARAVGLNVAHVAVGRAGAVDYLCVERYDRSVGPAGLLREHQEDFCQALNVSPDNKYQAEGGPSLKDCFNLLRSASSSPVRDLQAMLDAVVFNCLIGNDDAHGKNFSLLYGRDATGRRTVGLAPLYDLISTARYENLSKAMAMKLGGESDSQKLSQVHFAKFAEDVGLTKPIVRTRVAELASATAKAIDGVSRELPEAKEIALALGERTRMFLARVIH